MIKLKLISINPNPKGLYYDMDSYNTVMSNIKDLELRLFNFNFDKNEMDISNYKIIGLVKNVDLDNRTADIELKDFKLSDYDNYVVGFGFNGETHDNNMYHIESVKYAYLYHWNMNGVVDEPSLDPRDYKYSIAAGTIENNFPKTYTVKYLGNEVKDQGDISCCVACTLATINEAWEQKLNSDNDILFSEGWNYGALRKERTTSKGMISSEAISYATKIGMMSKDKYDISSEMPTVYDEVHLFDQLFKYAEKYKLTAYYKTSQGDTRTGRTKDLEIKHALTTYDVPLFSIAPKKFGNSHAICLVGWDDNEDKYILKNSWGPTCGSNGIIKISKDEIRDVYVLTREIPSIPFTDVPESEWYHNEVRNAYLNGSMKGVTETTFEPLGYVTRAQLATVLNRVYDEIHQQNKLLKELIDYKIENNKYKK